MTDHEKFIDRFIHKASLWKRINWRITKLKLKLARKWLKEHDPHYSANEAQQELIRRREIARKRGIGPADPRYPDIWDVLYGRKDK